MLLRRFKAKRGWGKARIGATDTVCGRITPIFSKQCAADRDMRCQRSATRRAASAWMSASLARSSPGKKRARVAVLTGFGVAIRTRGPIFSFPGLPTAGKGDLGGLGGAI